MQPDEMSLKAFKGLLPHIQPMEEKIMIALWHAGEVGRNNHELARECKIKLWTVSGRTGDLRKRKMIQRSGETRPTSPGSKNNGWVYVVQFENDKWQTLPPKEDWNVLAKWMRDELYEFHGDVEVNGPPADLLEQIQRLIRAVEKRKIPEE